MGKEVTIRGKSWERKNSLWIIWSFLGLASVGFATIGFKTKEKKWIVWGIIYFISLIGGLFFVGNLEGKIGEVLADIYMLVYIVSIVHSFITKKTYLVKYDKILYESEQKLRDEELRRKAFEQENLEKQKQIQLEKIKIMDDIEQAKTQKQKGTSNLEQDSLNRESGEADDIEQQKKKQLIKLTKILKNYGESINKENKKNTSDVNKSKQQTNDGIGIIDIIEGIVFLGVIICIGWVIFSSLGIGEIENSYVAESECGYELKDVFFVTPSERQVDIKAVSGKDGMVIVRVKIKDEEIFKYSIFDGKYGKDVKDAKEFYYGYEPLTGDKHRSYWGTTKDDVKEQMGW